MSHEIDWTKFLFYKDKQGLWEFGEDNYKEYYIPGESHPPPIAHYHWVKDVMFKSEILCPEEEYNKFYKGLDHLFICKKTLELNLRESGFKDIKFFDPVTKGNHVRKYRFNVMANK